jgi:hypothetical protein
MHYLSLKAHRKRKAQFVEHQAKQAEELAIR